MKILLLAGGTSGERPVSLQSGEAVWQGLTRLGHTVRAIDTADGSSLLNDAGHFLQPVGTLGEAAVRSGERNLGAVLSYERVSWAECVCIMLHGGAGEDGTVQHLVELTGVPYTGSGPLASSLCMNKGMTKRLVEAAEIATPGWLMLRRPAGGFVRADAELIAGQFELPIIIKPNDGGSTIGLTKVTRADEILPALHAATAERPTTLVEEFIAGKELTVSVIDGQALPIVEIRPHSGLYDYEAKYTKGKTNYLCPAPIDAGLAREIQSAAETAYQTVGCQGLARIDFMLTVDHQFAFLEINTLPGMTALSLAPMAAQAAGLSFDQLLERLLQLAFQR